MALLNNNPPDQDRNFTFRERINMSIRNSDLEGTVQELDSSNLTLDRFIDDRITIVSLTQKSATSARPRELAAIFNNIRDHAERLYSALMKARIPDCRSVHQILLHLESRTPAKKPSETLHHHRASSQLRFSVSLAWQASDAAPPCWQEGTITIAESEANGQSPVNDLCRIAECVNRGRHAFSFHLWKEQLTWDSGDKGIGSKQVETVTLRSLLQSQRKLKPRQRLELALNLASSLLQLNFTRWLPNCWTKDGIRFFRLPSESFVYSSQPLLLQSIQEGSSASVLKSLSFDPTDELFELGVMLMEIYLCKSFESYLAETQQSCRDGSRMARLPLMFGWFERDAEELPLKYRAVVADCFKFNFEKYERSWNNVLLRQAMCSAIIEPLEEDCAIF